MILLLNKKIKKIFIKDLMIMASKIMAGVKYLFFTNKEKKEL
jgi:hypothetical protein